MVPGWIIWFSILANFPLSLLVSSGNSTQDRKEKQLSVFTVVKFPNTVCTSATAGRNGTCYTASECAAKSGSASGSCASSFGVCCIFEKSCGAGSIAENCTYFTSTDRTLGAQCALTICKCSSDVCQLRLDFETFVMTNPVTATTITFGPGATAVAGSGTAGGQCQVDTFGVTTSGTKSPPTICGTNTGEHMYIPASDTCNVLNANFGSASTAGTSAFTIKVTQVPCNSKKLAPNGCLQYFTGSTGTIRSYNYNSASGQLLANQHHSSCIRAERTMCTICYYSTSFLMSVPGAIASVESIGLDTRCGIPGLGSGPGSAGTFVNGGSYDHIVIPDGQCDSPTANAVTAANEPNDRYCGVLFKCMTAAGVGGGGTSTAVPATSTVCSMHRPFKITIHTDGVEYAFPTAAGETAAKNRGFEISYYQKSACLTRP